MNAIQYLSYGSSDVLQLTTLPEAEPGPGEARVRLEAAGVSVFDTKLRAGLLRAHFAPVFPKIPGRDGVGIVDKVGADVTGVHVGDRVCVLAHPLRAGTYAEMIVCSADRLVFRPRGLSTAQAAALMQPGVSAWIPVVETAQVEAGMRVLIHGGAGAVGSLMVQLAHHLGAHVTATCRADNRDHVMALGADAVVSYDSEDFGRLCGLDVVFDLIGGQTHERSYPVLRRGGQMVYLTAQPIVDRSAAFGVRVTRAMISDAPAAMKMVAELAQQGAWRPGVSRILPLREAARAHATQEESQGTRGRIVLDIGGTPFQFSRRTGG